MKAFAIVSDASNAFLITMEYKYVYSTIISATVTAVKMQFYLQLQLMEVSDATTTVCFVANAIAEAPKI